MGYIRVTLLLAAAVTAGSATGAKAADFRFPSDPAISIPAAIPVPEYSGWYLRGDVAWSHNVDPDLSEAGVQFTGESFDDIWEFGAGIGYNLGDHVRGDITFDYRSDTDVSGITGLITHTADLSSAIVLANLYYDILSRDRFAPYVGFGFGISYNKTGVRAIAPPVSSTGGDDKTSLALSAMAGFSYRIHNGWMLDAGYRYLYMGDARTGIGLAPGALKIDDIQAHELRIGVRYEIY